MQNKTRLITILLLIIVAGVILIAILPARQLTPDIALKTVMSYSGNLYPGFTWSAPEATTTTMTENGSSTILIGTIIESQPIKNTMDPASTSAPFIAYYDKQLTGTGWTEDKSLDADGPASSSRTYKKGQQIVIISYYSDLKTQQEGSPSTCPCDMYFTVFSGE